MFVWILQKFKIVFEIHGVIFDYIKKLAKIKFIKSD